MIQISLQSKCPVTGTQSFGDSGIIPSYLLIDGGDSEAEMTGRKRLQSRSGKKEEAVNPIQGEERVLVSKDEPGEVKVRHGY